MNSQSSTPASETPSESATQTKTWNEGYTRDSYTHATSLPSSTAETAGQPAPSPQQKQEQKISLSNAWNSIQPGDFLSVHQTPCARQGFLTGIGGGAAVGAIRFIMGAPIPKAANWAVGLGILASVGQYEVCQYLRRQEKIKMQRVVEVYSKAQAESRKEAEERRRKAEEEAAVAAEAARQRKKSWYKFW